MRYAVNSYVCDEQLLINSGLRSRHHVHDDHRSSVRGVLDVRIFPVRKYMMAMMMTITMIMLTMTMITVTTTSKQDND